MKYKITSELVRGRIEVHVEYYEKGTKVYETNRAYPKSTKKSEIIEEVERAGDLFVAEREAREAQSVVDAEQEAAQSTVNSLNS
jgi:predicted nuclease with RNAse H fold